MTRTHQCINQSEREREERGLGEAAVENDREDFEGV